MSKNKPLQDIAEGLLQEVIKEEAEQEAESRNFFLGLYEEYRRSFPVEPNLPASDEKGPSIEQVWQELVASPAESGDGHVEFLEALGVFGTPRSAYQAGLPQSPAKKPRSGSSE